METDGGPTGQRIGAFGQRSSGNSPVGALLAGALRGAGYPVALAMLCGLSALASPAPGPGSADAPPCTGVVVTADTGAPVAGAVVRLVELGRVTGTDDDGAFRFTRVPPGEFTLGVHAPGFATTHRTVRLPTGDPIRVMLEPDYHFEEEVTVTALPWVSNPLETSQSVDQVGGADVRRAGNNSIGEALARVPGVSNVGTGDALGTPVIRGMSENRVRVLNDGVAVNHQQWSARHSPNLEPAFAERVEVVRGPASILWGPDALGGVVNVVPAPLPTAPEGEGALHGEVGAGYLGNNGQAQAQAVLEGARGGFGWRVGAIRRDAGDVETPDGTLPGTDYAQTNGTVAGGHTGSWGAARVRWHHWEDDVGFYFPGGSPSEGFRLRLEDDTASAEVVLPTGLGDVTALLSRQENVRRAFDPSNPAYPGEAVDLELGTTTARVGFEHRRVGAWKGKLAVEYRGVENTTVVGTLLPDYDSDGYAVMAIEEARFLAAKDGSGRRLIANLGLRWDGSDLVVPVDPAQPVVPDGFDRDYGAVTGSAGLVFRATGELSLAANVGRGWRPPNAFELFARGVHGGIAAYQVGNPDLVEESNLGAELSVRYQSGHWRAVATGYRSDLDDYIHSFDTGATDPGTGLPVFGFAQSDAVIEGLEADVRAVPVEPLEIGLVYSDIRSTNDGTGRRLPLTPPDRLVVVVRGIASKLGPLVAPFVEVEATRVDDGVPSGPDEPYAGTPSGAATAGYDLVHVRAGFQVVTRGGVVTVDLAVRNALDEAYTDFLYPYKGFGARNPGRDVRILARYRF